MRSIAVAIMLAVCIGTAFAQDAQERVGPQAANDAEIRNAFLPGIAASSLIPFETDTTYVGGSFHYSLIQGVTQARGSRDFGGYYEWYAEIGFYKELRSAFNADIFFTYQMGLNLSFEKFSRGSRGFLIPYFGAKVGGLYINEVGEGMLLEPVLGLVIAQNRYLNLTYDASLFLTTAALSDYIGTRHSLVLAFNL